MSDTSPRNDSFLDRAKAAILTHLEDEEFGVAELAEEMNMSRSTLLRRVKAATGLSAALFIRQQRLQHARKLLQQGTFTVSEVAYKTGFSSSSYFAKCFKEEFGHSPGEEGKQVEVLEKPPTPVLTSSRPVNWWIIGLIAGLVLLIGIGVSFWGTSKASASISPKTIAVLPFQNDSQDSSNVYLINGLMVALIDNLHQIRSLQVTSRTTVERYRGHTRTIPELAEELGVSYFVEGSGQKIGDEILLTLRLVDAQADTLIWARRYKRETTDIFQLQTEVSRSIAQEIEVIITPEEEERLELPPTDNLLAYDHYLRGLDEIRQETREGLIKGIASFEQAIAEDPDFAHPHAFLAISYYFLDLFQVDQTHIEDINTYADKALLLDPTLNESLIGKALYYMQTGQYDLAIQFFDKVLTRSPDLGWVHNLLSTIYTVHLPNTEQYLRHSLQGIRHVVAGQDSNTTSMAYLHLANALTQNGFLAEAESIVEKSLAYQPHNLFARTLSIYVELGQSNELDSAYQRFQLLLEKDSSFLSTLQELGKIAMYRGDYEASWEHYQHFLVRKQAAGLDIYQGANINIAYVLDQLGRREEAIPYREQYLAYLEGTESSYGDLGHAVYYASKGEKPKAMTYFEAFSEADGFQFWMVQFIEQDPIIATLSGTPGYNQAIQRIKDTFWAQHQRMRSVLKTEGVI